LARGRAKKRWRPAKAATAQIPAPVANDNGTTTELQRKSLRLAREAGADRVARIEPTPEQLRRGTYALKKTKDPDTATSIEVRRNAAAPIDRWRARGLLTPRRFDACDRYRSDYARGGYERSVISRYDGGGGSGDGTPNMSGLMAATLAQLDARDRLREARSAVPRRFAGYFDAIVLHGAEAGAIGGELGASGPRRTGLAIFVVEICADILGDFYRMPE
jgi:hypothetical protein